MIQTILAFFGYTKIPIEAVQLSMLVESEHRRVAEKLPDNEYAQRIYKAAKTITEFLRSGRLLG